VHVVPEPSSGFRIPFRDAGGLHREGAVHTFFCPNLADSLGEVGLMYNVTAYTAALDDGDAVPSLQLGQNIGREVPADVLLEVVHGILLRAACRVAPVGSYAHPHDGGLPDIYIPPPVGGYISSYPRGYLQAGTARYSSRLEGTPLRVPPWSLVYPTSPADPYRWVATPPCTWHGVGWPHPHVYVAWGRVDPPCQRALYTPIQRGVYPMPSPSRAWGVEVYFSTIQKTSGVEGVYLPSLMTRHLD